MLGFEEEKSNLPKIMEKICVAIFLQPLHFYTKDGILFSVLDDLDN
ncbi:hypothetical protein [Sulfurihydrogenibium sp.]|nr:hypothetical protein [Sulfurihydrogenibium sp.]